MKRILVYILGLLIIYSCSNKEREIDNTVNLKIAEKFSKYNPDLWESFENEFFMRLVESGFLNDETDTINAIHNLNTGIMAAGYNPEFFVDLDKKESKKLISNLEKISYKADDESAHRFLFDLLTPIISSFETENNITLDSTNFIKAYTLFDPNEIPVNYDLSMASLERIDGRVEELWNQKGTRKMLILFYMSRMINENYPQQRL